MARVKQTARQLTEGKAPRAELARKAARKPSGGRGAAEENRQHNVASLAAFSQLRCTAIKVETDDDDESGDGNPAEIMVLCSDLHPFVVDFLKLLGPGTTVSVSILQILLDDNVHNPAPGEEEEGTAEFVPFERMKLTHNPAAARNNDVWVIEGCGWPVLEEDQREGDSVTPVYTPWTRVSSSACCGIVNGLDISLRSYAEEDPGMRDLWNKTIQQVASSFLSTFRECQTKIQGTRGYGKKRLTTAMDFPHGSRIPSTTPIRERDTAVPTPCSRENDPTFSCVTASLANLVWETEKRFANWVAEVATRNFRNLCEFANFLQYTCTCYSDARANPFRVVKCLPCKFGCPRQRPRLLSL
jgi:hypothetical protein